MYFDSIEKMGGVNPCIIGAAQVGVQKGLEPTQKVGCVDQVDWVDTFYGPLRPQCPPSPQRYKEEAEFALLGTAPPT